MTPEDIIAGIFRNSYVKQADSLYWALNMAATAPSWRSPPTYALRDNRAHSLGAKAIVLETSFS